MIISGEEKYKSKTIEIWLMFSMKKLLKFLSIHPLSIH